MQYDPKTFSKERIKSRMLRKAAELWGYQESEMDAFDPLVTLLIEACAVELEKIAQETNATQYRVMDRLANLMNPDIDAAKPSFGVARVRAVDARAVIPSEAQLVFRKPNAGRNSGNDAGPAEVFFSPVSDFTILDGAVDVLAQSTHLYQIENGNQKVLLATSDKRSPAYYQTLWLGLSFNSDIESLEGLSFFFDWQNEPDKEALYQHLPFTRWFLGDNELKVKIGLESKTVSQPATLDDEFDVSKKLEKHVTTLFHKCFLTVSSAPRFKAVRYVPQKYPVVLEKLFSIQDLKNLREELVWLKVQFPQSLPPDALTNVFCAINSFPVINRSLQKLTYRLQQNLNIVPLESNESFLTVKDVRNANNVVYKAIPLVSPQELGVEMYTLQYGVGRFDKRDAKELLYYLLELLRDESSAFTALGEDFLSSIIRELNQNIARLEQKVSQEASQKTPVPYIVVKPKGAGENVYIEYWTTSGEAGNRVPAGSKLTLYSGSYLMKNEIYLLTSTLGGKEKLKATEKIHAYKRALLTHHRAVTPEDIRIICLAELGSRVNKVEVRKGFVTSTAPNAGFLRCIEVVLTPADSRILSTEEWKSLCEELKVTLEGRSTTNLPFQVKMGN